MTVSMMQPMAGQVVGMPQMSQLYAQGIMSPATSAQLQAQVAAQRGMLSPAMAAASMVQQPVYINSLAQLPPGAVPVDQGMLSQALGQTVTPPPSMISTVLKSALKFAGIGGAAGAVFGLLPGPPGMMVGGLVGALGGAVLGAVLGIKKAKQQQNDFQKSLNGVGEQAAGIASQVGGAAAATAATATAALAAPTAVKAAKKRAAAKKVAAKKAAAAHHAAVPTKPQVAKKRTHK